MKLVLLSRVDNGYYPEKIIEELKKIYPAIMTKIRLKLSPKPSKLEKENLGKKRVSSRKCQMGK